MLATVSEQERHGDSGGKVRQGELQIGREGREGLGKRDWQ